MGGAIGVQRKGLHDANPIRAIVDNEQKSNKLFDEIARAVEKKSGDRINSSSHINIRNLFQYFINEDHGVEFVKGMNKEIICLAHKHCVEHIHECQVKREKRKAKKNKNHKVMRRRSWSKPEEFMGENISKGDFKFLLACLYLYEHMYKIFNLLDKIDSEDMRISRGEYSKGKAELVKIPYLTHVSQVSDEQWEEEFTKIDCDNNGWINFEELCKYAVQIMVLQPIAFLESRDEIIVTSGLDEEDDEYHIGVCMSCAEQVAKLLEEEAALEIARVRSEYEEISKSKDDQLIIASVSNESYDSSMDDLSKHKHFTVADISKDADFEPGAPLDKEKSKAYLNMGVSFQQNEMSAVPIELKTVKENIF